MGYMLEKGNVGVDGNNTFIFLGTECKRGI